MSGRPKKRFTRIQTPHGETAYVPSVDLARVLVQYLEENPDVIISRAEKAFGLYHGAAYMVIRRYYPNGTAVIDRLSQRPRTIEIYRPVQNSEVEKAHKLLADIMVMSKENQPPPEYSYPYVLRYRSQHKGTHLAKDFLDGDRLDEERKRIAAERGWNFHYVLLCPMADA